MSTDTPLSKQIAYWKISAKRDRETAHSLFALKRYDMCLFLCHLAIEKLLKGLVAFHLGEPAPFSHDLERLALLAGMSLTDTEKKDLKEISSFNIAGRYDDYKHSFYKKCTPAYAKKYLAKTDKLFLWLEQKYQNE